MLSHTSHTVVPPEQPGLKSPLKAIKVAATMDDAMPCSPWWRTVAETQQPRFAAPCHESTTSSMHCEVETHNDGSRWRRCRELHQSWRICEGR